MTARTAREVLEALVEWLSPDWSAPISAEDLELAIRTIIREEIRNTTVSHRGDLIPDSAE